MEASMAFRGSLGVKGLLSTTIFEDPWGGLFIGSEEEGWLSFNSSDHVLSFYQTKASATTRESALSGNREQFFISSYFF